MKKTEEQKKAKVEKRYIVGKESSESRKTNLYTHKMSVKRRSKWTKRQKL